MAKLSAGILLYKLQAGGVKLFLVHPGGPFWAKKDAGAWSVPKGEYAEGDDPLVAAKREFKEETGQEVPLGEVVDLGEVKYGNKKLIVWALQGELDASAITSNTFSLEWPPKSGQIQGFPEVDRAGWFPPARAEEKLVKGQRELVGRLLGKLGIPSSGQATKDEPDSPQLTLL